MYFSSICLMVPKSPGVAAQISNVLVVSTTGSFNGGLSVFNSQWHLPHNWYWLPLMPQRFSQLVHPKAHTWPIHCGCYYRQYVPLPFHHFFTQVWCLTPIVFVICGLPHWTKHRRHVSQKALPTSFILKHSNACALKMLFLPICFAW